MAPLQPRSPWQMVGFKDGPGGSTIKEFRHLLEHTFKDEPLQIIIDLNRGLDSPTAPITGTRLNELTSLVFNQAHLRRTHELVIYCDSRAPNPILTNTVFAEDDPKEPYATGLFFCPFSGLPSSQLENLVIMFALFPHTGRINDFFRHCVNLRYMTVWSAATPTCTRRLAAPATAFQQNAICLARLVLADLTLSFARCMEEMKMQTPELAELRVTLDDPRAPPDRLVLSFARGIRVAKLAGAFTDAHVAHFIEYHANIEALVLDRCPVGTAFAAFLTLPPVHTRYFAHELTHLSVWGALLGDEDVLRICEHREGLRVWLIECENITEALAAMPQARGNVTRHETFDDYWDAREESKNPDYPLPPAREGSQRELYMTEPDM